MKKLLSLFTFLMFLSGSLLAQNNEAKAKIDETNSFVTFEQEVMDYGEIERGADPYRVFKFTNVSDEPVVIKSARGSCGCTVPTYPKEPIGPGETAEVKVRYDTNRVGAFTKTVTLSIAKGERQVTRVLTIKGKVNQKAEPKSLPNKTGSIFNNGN